MRSTDCGSCKEKSIWVHPAAAGPFYWHIRWDIGGEIGLICFSCHLNGRSLSRGKALTGLRSRWANSQSSFIGFLLQTLCLMRPAACNQLPVLKKWGKKSSGRLSSHVDLSVKGRRCLGSYSGEVCIFRNLPIQWVKKKINLILKPLLGSNRLDDISYCYIYPTGTDTATHFPFSSAALASCFLPWLRFHLEVNRCQAAARAPRRWQRN